MIWTLGHPQALPRQLVLEGSDIIQKAQKDLGMDVANNYNFAFVGARHSGKTSLLNALRDTPDFVKNVPGALGDTVKCYPVDKASHVVLWEISHDESDSAKEYFRSKLLQAFDCVLITTMSHFTKLDKKIAKHARKSDTPHVFVRSSADKELSTVESGNTVELNLTVRNKLEKSMLSDLSSIGDGRCHLFIVSAQASPEAPQFDEKRLVDSLSRIATENRMAVEAPDQNRRQSTFRQILRHDSKLTRSQTLFATSGSDAPPPSVLSVRESQTKVTSPRTPISEAVNVVSVRSRQSDRAALIANECSEPALVAALKRREYFRIDSSPNIHFAPSPVATLEAKLDPSAADSSRVHSSQTTSTSASDVTVQLITTTTRRSAANRLNLLRASTMADMRTVNHEHDDSSSKPACNFTADNASRKSNASVLGAHPDTKTADSSLVTLESENANKPDKLAMERSASTSSTESDCGPLPTLSHFGRSQTDAHVARRFLNRGVSLPPAVLDSLKEELDRRNNSLSIEKTYENSSYLKRAVTQGTSSECDITISFERPFQLAKDLQLAAVTAQPQMGTVLNDSCVKRIKDSRDKLCMNPKKINLGFVGGYNSGKSTLINALRGVADSDIKRSAVSGVFNPTSEIKPFNHPSNRELVLWDCPGGGTPKNPAETYFEAMHLFAFDGIVLVCVDRFTSLDATICRKARDWNVPLIIVRNKAFEMLVNLRCELGGHKPVDVLEKELRRRVKGERDAVGMSERLFVLSGWAFSDSHIPKVDEDRFVAFCKTWNPKVVA